MNKLILIFSMSLISICTHAERLSFLGLDWKMSFDNKLQHVEKVLGLSCKLSINKHIGGDIEVAYCTKGELGTKDFCEISFGEGNKVIPGRIHFNCGCYGGCDTSKYDFIKSVERKYSLTAEEIPNSHGQQVVGENNDRIIIKSRPVLWHGYINVHDSHRVIFEKGTAKQKLNF